MGMKKTPGFICIAITLLLSTRTFSQDFATNSLKNIQTDTVYDIPYALPAKIDFSIPINIRIVEKRTNPEYNLDYFSTGKMEKTILLSREDTAGNITANKYSLNGNVFLGNQLKDTKSGISFELDTINKLLKRIKIFYILEGPTIYGERDSFTIGEMPYQIVWNYHLYASLSGINFLSQISNVDYYWLRVGPLNFNDILDERHYFRTLNTDTGAYRISIDLATTDPAREVNLRKQLTDNFSIKADNISPLIIFSFRESTIPKIIKIYDIVGREVLSETLSPNVSSFVISKNQFLTGCYFVTVNGKVQKFVIH